MSRVFLLRNIVYSKPNEFINLLPLVEREDPLVSNPIEENAGKILAQNPSDKNNSREIPVDLSVNKFINLFIFSKLKDLSSQLSYDNPRLYKDLVDSYIPTFFSMSKENQMILKDELQTMLEDFVPVKHLNLDEHTYIQIENALADSLKENSFKSPINADELILARMKKEININGIEKFPILSVFITKLALQSAVNLVVKNYKNSLEIIENNHSQDSYNYLELQSNIQKDLLFRNVSDFISKLNDLEIDKAKLSDHDKYIIAKNEKSINDSLANLKFYADDREDFKEILDQRKQQIHRYFKDNFLSFSNKEKLLSDELFPKLDLNFDSALDFDKDKFAENPLAYTKQYLNILESISSKGDLKNQRMIVNSLREIYSSSHLFLDKDIRLRFFSALFNNTPHITENLVNKTNVEEKDFEFFKLLIKNIFTDYLNSEDSNDIFMSKNLISIFSHSPDNEIRDSVFKLANKLIDKDLENLPNLKSSFKVFFESLLANNYENDVKQFFFDLILKIN